MVIFNTTWKILIPIFKFPTKGLTVREISRETKISHPTVLKIVNKLIKKRILTYERKAKAMFIKGNFSNENFIRLKRIYNLLSLKPLIKFLVENFSPDVIICFGSYAEGRDFENSDIDIYVGYEKIEIKSLEKFEKKLNRKIQIFSDNLRKYPKELKENIINGVKLYGWIKL